MGTSAASVAATCSVCGEALNRKAECLACLLRAALDQPVPESTVSRSVVFGDFEIALQQNQRWWDKLNEHDRGELLGALADGWLQLGDTGKANVFLDRMTNELPGTPYAKNAAQRRTRQDTGSRPRASSAM